MKHKQYLRFRKSIYEIISFFILLNFPFLISFAVEEEYKSQIRSEDFKEVYFKGDIKYEDVDSFYNQFNLFFGTDYSLEKKNGFRDLSLQLSSTNIRKLY